MCDHRVVGILVTCGGGTTTSGNIIEIDVWLKKWAITLIVAEVPGPPTVDSVGYSSLFGSLFWGKKEFFGCMISTKILPLLRRINTQTLKVF